MMQSPNFPPPTVRSSNFELLRIFCMLSIVAVHYVWHGGSAASGSNIAAAYFLGNFAQIGVACFVLIGAWFLIDKEFSITRIFNLSKQITFYSLSIALLLFIIGMASYTDIIKNAMPIIFKRYWFLTPYVFLLFLHPFLNYVLNACSKKQIRFLCIKIIFPANTFWEWLEIYPIMLVSYFFIKKSVWIKRICTFMGQISLESYLTNGCMILLIGLLPWETTLDHLNYGNYLRYTLIIVTGITTAYCANRIINKITARL